MKFTLLSQVNEDVRQDDEYFDMVNQAIDILGFDRKEVICTEAQLSAFLDKVSDRALLEQVEGAASAKAGERDWVSDLANNRYSQDTDHDSRRLGLPKEKVQPAQGQRIVLPGRGGIGSIVALDLKSNQVMVRDKAGREFVVKVGELAGPKMVGNEATWMLKQ